MYITAFMSVYLLVKLRTEPSHWYAYVPINLDYKWCFTASLMHPAYWSQKRLLFGTTRSSLDFFYPLRLMRWIKGGKLDRYLHSPTNTARHSGDSQYASMGAMLWCVDHNLQVILVISVQKTRKGREPSVTSLGKPSSRI
jgi:hypothetical protein